MTLADGTIGDMYTVVDIQTDTNIERRLEALGLIRGTKIQLLGRKRSGTSIFYCARHPPCGRPKNRLRD